MGGFTKAQNKAFSASNCWISFSWSVQRQLVLLQVVECWIILLEIAFMKFEILISIVAVSRDFVQIQSSKMEFFTSYLLKLFWLLYSCRTCNYTACNAGRRILNNISENCFLWRLQYWYPLYSHVKSFCVNQKWKSS